MDRKDEEWYAVIWDECVAKRGDSASPPAHDYRAMANVSRTVGASSPAVEARPSAREQACAREEARRRLTVALAEARSQSADSGTAKLTAEEIDAEIKQTRAERTKADA
jgi:hypothetical protein